MTDVLSPERSARTRQRRLVRPTSIAWVTVPISVLVFWIAYDKGTYALEDRTALAVVVWWALGAGVVAGIWPVRAPTLPTVRFGVLLTAFAGWTGASAVWASSAEAAYEEFVRVLLYVGVFVLVVAVAPFLRRDRVADGVAIAVVGIAVAALVARCFPSVLSPGSQFQFLPVAQTRLSFPLGYWNGMGIFMAFGLPLLLRTATRASSPIVRAAAIAPFPVMVVALYLTSSRGGFLTAAVGVLAFFALAGRRAATTAALVVGLAAAALAVAFVRVRTEFVNDPTAAAATGQGHWAAVVVLACALGAAAAYAVVDRLLVPRVDGSKRLDRALLVGAAAVVAVGIAASNPVQRIEDFKQTPAAFQENDYVTAHLLSGSGNGRWQYWSVAFDEFKDDPFLGGGAGSFREYWEQHRDFYVISLDAHSLYPEVLGELGIVGLLLIVAALAVAVVAAVRRARSDPGAGAEGPALAAVFLAFVVALGVDWMWELTAVTIVGFLVLAVLLESDRTPAHERISRPPPRLRMLVAAVAVVAVVLEGLPFVAAVRLDQSRAAIRRGDTDAAVERAESARRLTPWAASPYLQLALVQEQAGELGQARRAIADALERDPDNWQLWIVRARLETKAGAIRAALRSLDRARERNPFAALPSG